MTEAEFTREVLALAVKHHLLGHWCRDSRHCEGRPGLPDLIIISASMVMFAELKLLLTDTSADQDDWLWHLERVSGYNHNVLTRIYTPEDLASGMIESDFRMMDN